MITKLDFTPSIPGENKFLSKYKIFKTMKKIAKQNDIELKKGTFCAYSPIRKHIVFDKVRLKEDTIVEKTA